jgi:gliding motility-associated-like protein
VLDPSLSNNKPSVNNDIAIVPSGSSTTTNILSNDIAGNAGGVINASSVSIITQPLHGTVVVNNDGTITYTPDNGFTGTDKLTYQVCDNANPANCSTAEVFYTVVDANASTSTVANDDIAKVVASLDGSTTVSGNVLNNDNSTTGKTLTASIPSGNLPASDKGTIQFNADGTYTFTPAAGYTGPVDIIYQVCDNSNPSVCSKATLHIIVEPSSVLNPDVNATIINVPVNGSLSTNDQTNPGTTYQQPAVNPNNPSGGSITVNLDGTYSFTATTPGKYVYYVPVCAAGQTTGCPLTPLEISVLDPLANNNKPVVNNDYAYSKLNTPVTVAVLLNDESGNTGISLNVSSVTISSTTNHGTSTVNNDGTISFVPNAGFIGTDSLVYSVCDNSLPTAICNTAVVYFTIEPSSATNKTVAIDDYGTVTNTPNGGVSVSGNVLTNDKSTISNATLTASVITGPTSTQGVFTLNANGSYTFTAAAGFSGPIDIVYQVCDNSNPAVCSKATLHIIVEPAPVLTLDINVTNVNIPVTGSLSTNDVVAAGTSYGQPSDNPSNPTGASITMNTNGSYTFSSTTPGKYVYYVPVCAVGQTSGCPLSPLEITVVDPSLNTNLPIVNNDNAVVKQGSTVSTNVLANDKSVNLGGSINASSLVITTDPTHGTVVKNADGTISYTPTAGYVGTDSLVYKVCDNTSPTALCSTAVVYYTVLPSNASSTNGLTDDFNSSSNGATVTGNVLTNDKNSNGSTLTVTGHSGPVSTKGTIEFNSNGTYTFTPAVGYSGPVDIVYTACTSSTPSVCSNATLHIDVLPIYALNPDIAITDINKSVSGQLSTNDKLSPGSTYGVPYADSNNPIGGTITINPDGSYTFNATIPGKYIYNVPVCPAGQSSGCPLSPLEITVLDPSLSNNKPSVNNDIAIVPSGSSTTTNILSNDIAGNAGGVINASSVSIITQPLHGTVVVNNDGTITYTPDNGFTGTDKLTYQVCDNANPANCSTAEVFYTVVDANASTSTVANDDIAKVVASLDGSTTVSGNVLNNDNSTTGKTLTASIPSGNLPASDKGTIQFNADGTYTFTPAAGYTGPVDIIYQVCDNSNPSVCSKATLHIIVEPSSVLNPDVNATIINVPVNGSLSTNDQTNPGTTYQQPAVNPNNPSGGSITVNLDGTYSFTATTPGKYVYYVPVCAAGQTTGCPLTPLEISVLDPLANNNKPVVNNDYAYSKLNTPVTVAVLLNDESGNTGISLNVSSVTISSTTNHGTSTVNNDGTISFVPNAGFIGTDSLVYSVCDNSLPTAICNTAVVYFTIEPSSATNKTVAIDDYGTVTNTPNGGVSVSGNVLTNDKSTISNATLTASVITGPTSTQGVFTLNANGSYTFTAAAGFSGPIDIVYQVCDNSNPAVCSKATLHIIVEPAPVLTLDINVTNVNIPVTGSLSTNDVVAAGTSYGQPSDNPSNPTGASITMNTNGSYTFSSTTPGKYVYYVPVCAVGQTSGCPLSPLEITVVDPSLNTNLPIVNNDNAVVKQGSTVSTNVLANDKSVNLGGSINASSLVITTDPTHGTVVKNADGTISYTPTAGYVGTDSLVYKVCDNTSPTALCSTAVVYYTVLPSNASSTNGLTDDFNSSSNGATVTGNVLTNDKNSNGSTLTVTGHSGPVSTKGTIEFNSNGTYTFTPAVGYSGPVDIVYTACTSSTPSVCSNATLHIDVLPSANIINDNNSGTVDVPITGNVATNDIAPNSTYGTPIPNSANIAGASINMNADGTYSFMASKIGIYRFTIPVCAQGQTINCPTSELVINVSYLPQVAMNLVYPTLLQADSVHMKFTLTDGVGPYTVIIKNSLDNKIDTVRNLMSGDKVKLAPRRDDTRYTVLKVIDSNNVSRILKFTKDTANLNVLKPQLLLTLKAELPTKLPDNSFKTKILMKIKNNGEIDLQGVQVNADLSKVFPKDMRYTLDSVRVARGVIKLNPSYTGLGAQIASSYITKVKDGFTIKYRSQSGLSGSDLFDNGVNLKVDEESDVVFYFTINPGKILDPLVLQFTGNGNGILTQKDGNISMEPASAISHDNSNLLKHPIVTTVGTPLPTYIPFFLVNEIGASLQGSKADTVAGGYIFHFTSIIKNLSNSNLDSLYVTLNLNNFYKLPDVPSIVGVPKISGSATLNPNFNGTTDTALIKWDGYIKVSDSIKINYDVFVQTTKGRYAWPNYIIATGLTTVGDLHISDTSTNGLNPDPNGDLIPDEDVLTIVQVGFTPPAIPIVDNATYNAGDTNNPTTIKSLIKSTPVGTVPMWCDPTGSNCYVEPPLLPKKPGVYIWCVKSLDTATGLNSEPCVMDTVTILPVVNVKNLTIMNSVISNPKNISGLITSITTGSIPQWCDINGSNCSTTAPLVPSKPGLYVWCVKAIDTATRLSSTPCKLDTLNILDPYNVVDIQKTTKLVKVNPDGSIRVDFLLKVTNKTNEIIDSIQVKDDLTYTFNTTTGFKLIGFDLSGTLYKNNSYDGNTNIDLVTKNSKLGANKTDSILLSVLIQSPDIHGNYANTAKLNAFTKFGNVNLISNDPILNPGNVSTRTPAQFVVPKLDVIVPEGFSPNNDGIDDTWIIIRPFGTVLSVKVFNRWGNEVYRNENYLNDWRGKGIVNFLGEDIPEGTYFYTVEATDKNGNKKQLAGPLLIKK